MAPRTIYANLPDGLQPFTLWDASLADMGSLGVIPCTATGTNAIVLIPVGSVNAPNVAIPQALQAFSFVAVGNSSGAVTIQIGTTAALKLYRMDGVTQASTGDIVSTVLYFVAYNAALNGAVGGFQILAPISNEINPIISGATISNSTITTSTYNGNIWTAGTGTLTIAAGKTETFNNTLTFAGTDGTTQTFQASDTIVGRATTDTLTNKTIGAATLSGTLSGGGNQINNVIIGTTAPLAGSFTSLTASGAITGTSNANSQYNAITLTNTDPGAAANVVSTFATTNAGSFLLAALSTAGGGNAILNWTGAGGLAIQNQNAAGGMFFGTGATPTNALIISAAQNVSVPAGSFLSTHATAGLGFGTGAGGAVTQITSRATGVTLNKSSGAITLFSAAGVNTAATAITFTVTNSAVAATDTVILSQKSGADKWLFFVTAVGAGSFNITGFTTAGTTVEQPVINFNVIKGVVT